MVTLQYKMADFKFNFASPGSDEEADISQEEIHPSLFPRPETLRSAKEIVIPPDISSFLSSKVDELAIGDGGFSIKHVCEESVEQNLKEKRGNYACDIVTASEKQSDLIPLVYEGGLKIWECSVDLVKYLMETGLEFKGKRVLEIGCGAGLPGIFALLKGAEVDFQDYNEDVIQYVTIPNVLMNLDRLRENTNYESDLPSFDLKEIASKRCRFFSGDWGSVVDIINPKSVKEMTYDVILTSETIYEVNSHVKLYHFIKSHLKKPNGVVYVAAKTHYFGVGGGTRSFEKLVKTDGVFHISACMVSSVGVKREILCMIIVS